MPLVKIFRFLYRYLFSFAQVPCLYSAALSTPLVHLEDVFVSGILAQRCGVERVNDRTVFPGNTFNCKLNLTNFSLVHYKRNRAKERLYEQMMKRREQGKKSDLINDVIRTQCDGQPLEPDEKAMDREMIT